MCKERTLTLWSLQPHHLIFGISQSVQGFSFPVSFPEPREVTQFLPFEPVLCAPGALCICVAHVRMQLIVFTHWKPVAALYVTLHAPCDKGFITVSLCSRTPSFVPRCCKDALAAQPFLDVVASLSRAVTLSVAFNLCQYCSFAFHPVNFGWRNVPSNAQEFCVCLGGHT